MQELLPVLIKGILLGESVHQVRHRHKEAEPKIFSRVKLSCENTHFPQSLPVHLLFVLLGLRCVIISIQQE